MPMMSHPCRLTLAASLVAVAVGLVALGVESRAQAPGGASARAMPVTATVVQPQDVAVRVTYPGRAYGAREVEVRARIGGVLEERLYVEGQTVEPGRSLFRIDPKPFEVGLQRALAEQQRAQADLALARREWQRASELFQRNVVSESERDRRRSAVEQAEATLALAEAGVAQARLELDYTRVEAPIAGITGLESLPEGSLIDRGALLTTITQLDVIHVRFALPGAAPTNGVQRAATLLMPDGTAFDHPGTVDFTNATVHPNTGTIQARAVFPNPDRTVRPGQFVRVRVETDLLRDVYLIDRAAVVQGPSGTAVFVIDENDAARIRPVTLGPVVDGRQVVLDGLQPGDRVVVNGQVALRDGAPVMVTSPADGTN